MDIICRSKQYFNFSCKFWNVSLPFANMMQIINTVCMILLTAFISPKPSPVSFITKLFATKNRPDVKAIAAPSIWRIHVSDWSNEIICKLNWTIWKICLVLIFIGYLVWWKDSLTFFLCHNVVFSFFWTFHVNEFNWNWIRMITRIRTDFLWYDKWNL